MTGECIALRLYFLDAVCPDRLPRWEDLDNLPYIRCIMKEVWRVGVASFSASRTWSDACFQWRPPVALGHPHLTTRDIAFQNMVIPKGAYLHLNAWAIQHDPARHENPDDFVPERYVDDHTTVSRSIVHRRLLPLTDVEKTRRPSRVSMQKTLQSETTSPLEPGGASVQDITLLSVAL